MKERIITTVTPCKDVLFVHCENTYTKGCGMALTGYSPIKGTWKAAYRKARIDLREKISDNRVVATHTLNKDVIFVHCGKTFCDVYVEGCGMALTGYSSTKEAWKTAYRKARIDLREKIIH